jgi:hypothetical protein
MMRISGPGKRWRIPGGRGLKSNQSQTAGAAEAATVLALVIGPVPCALRWQTHHHRCVLERACSKVRRKRRVQVNGPGPAWGFLLQQGGFWMDPGLIRMRF